MTTATILSSTDSRAVLVELASAFHWPSAIGNGAEVVAPDQMPEPFRHLLVHEKHMTVMLEAKHGGPVDLTVLEHRKEAELYRRKIILRSSVNHQIVELGLVRLDLTKMPAPVREEILKEQTPLGRILITHKVHRRIEPRWYLKFPAHSPALESVVGDLPEPVYGRIGTIYCDHQPALELLEVIFAPDGQPAKANS